MSLRKKTAFCQVSVQLVHILCPECCIRVWRAACKTPGEWWVPCDGSSCPCLCTPSRWFQEGCLGKRWPPGKPAAHTHIKQDVLSANLLQIHIYDMNLINTYSCSTDRRQTSYFIVYSSNFLLFMGFSTYPVFQSVSQLLLHFVAPALLPASLFQPNSWHYSFPKHIGIFIYRIYMHIFTWSRTHRNMHVVSEQRHQPLGLWAAFCLCYVSIFS